MAQDAARSDDGLAVNPDPQVEAAEQARSAALKDDLKAARQRVKDAQAHLAALEKEAGK